MGHSRQIALAAWWLALLARLLVVASSKNSAAVCSVQAPRWRWASSNPPIGGAVGGAHRPALLVGVSGAATALVWLVVCMGGTSTCHGGGGDGAREPRWVGAPRRWRATRGQGAWPGQPPPGPAP